MPHKLFSFHCKIKTEREERKEEEREGGRREGGKKGDTEGE